MVETWNFSNTFEIEKVAKLSWGINNFPSHGLKWPCPPGLIGLKQWKKPCSQFLKNVFI